MRLLMVLAFIGLLLSAEGSHAQFAPGFDKAQASRAFEAASEGHVLNVQRVGQIRGMSQQRATTLTVDAVAAVMAQPDGPTAYHPRTRLLFYTLDDQSLSAWLIDRNGLVAASRTQHTRRQLSDAAISLRMSLNVDGIARSRSVRLLGLSLPAATTRNRLDQDLDDLSAMLLPQTIRAGLKGVDHLMVIGPGAITSIPLAILKLDRKAMLIDRMTVSVSPGLYDFGQPVERWQGAVALAKPLIVGNPLVGPSAIWEVPGLPGAESEARAFAALTKASVLTGAAARKDTVLRDIDAASMLYFAAHGVASPDDPMSGGFLMLAGNDAEGGFLRAGEVQRRKLKARLVVLSACQSGLGMPHDGGMIGLTRAFRSAGAPRVVMSLWSVSDDATVVLMDRFQRELQRHMPATALRLAMLETRKLYPEPRYWAPFALYGTPR
jgi:CHAT domain-containing protein